MFLDDTDVNSMQTIKSINIKLIEIWNWLECFTMMMIDGQMDFKLCVLVSIFVCSIFHKTATNEQQQSVTF